jgi:hypothetical protein
MTVAEVAYVVGLYEIKPETFKKNNSLVCNLLLQTFLVKNGIKIRRLCLDKRLANENADETI